MNAASIRCRPSASRPTKKQRRNSAGRRGAQSLDLAIVTLADAWALRRLAMCMRSPPELAPAAQALADALAAWRDCRA